MAQVEAQRGGENQVIFSFKYIILISFGFHLKIIYRICDIKKATKESKKDEVSSVFFPVQVNTPLVLPTHKRQVNSMKCVHQVNLAKCLCLYLLNLWKQHKTMYMILNTRAAVHNPLTFYSYDTDQ